MSQRNIQPPLTLGLPDTGTVGEQIVAVEQVAPLLRVALADVLRGTTYYPRGNPLYLAIVLLGAMGVADVEVGGDDILRASIPAERIDQARAFLEFEPGGAG